QMQQGMPYPQQSMQQPQMQQQMPQQQMPQQQGYANGSSFGGQNQYAGQNMGSQQNYTPLPQSAPQGAFDPRLAQQLNNPQQQYQATQSPAPSNTDPMSSYGLSGRSSDQGVMVSAVRAGSRAAKAGLRKGDVIRTVDGNEVMQPSQLNQYFSQYDS